MEVDDGYGHQQRPRLPVDDSESALIPALVAICRGLRGACIMTVEVKRVVDKAVVGMNPGHQEGDGRGEGKERREKHASRL